MQSNIAYIPPASANVLSLEDLLMQIQQIEEEHQQEIRELKAQITKQSDMEKLPKTVNLIAPTDTTIVRCKQVRLLKKRVAIAKTTMKRLIMWIFVLVIWKVMLKL